MVTVTFGEPGDVTQGGFDGKTIAFPFEVRRLGIDARRDDVTEHVITVEISGNLLIKWEFERRPEDIKALSKSLFEYARKTAFKKLIDGSLSEHQKVELYSHNTETTYPFAPNKLNEPKGASYQIDLDEERRLYDLKQKEQRLIGF